MSDVLYSCKMCGLKPVISQCNMDMSYQYQCVCGASGSRSTDAGKALEYWNKLAYCSSWNDSQQLTTGKDDNK